MANEISVSASLSASKNQAVLSLSATGTQDMTGNDMTQLTQDVTTTPELVALLDVATPAAFLFIRNLETDTNDVHVSLNSDGSNKISTIKPGKFILISPSVGQNTYIFASSTAAIVQIGAVEI
jgi:hypothetical protein